MKPRTMKARLLVTAVAALPLALATAPANGQVGVGIQTPGVGIDGRPSGSAPSSRYAMPPTGMMIKSAFAGVQKDETSLDALAEVMEDIDSNLGECRSMGNRLDMEMTAARGDRAVHPDWIRRYQNCIEQSEEDIRDMKDILESRDPGTDSDKLAALKEELEELEDDLDDAFDDQRDLVSDYNFGG